ncbi:hypothetical protein [Lactiplantibacillus daowaiensis]|uniref:Extracellular protein n=1 Tax=Lactiplantibacillus daowaiensis TaxID=2559918 RepID=A0ABW1S430_9LACO|nr:hypothetical protein [Lactiplantibacillus daowaiensis]
MMKNIFTKLTITLMTAGTLFATTGTALADTKPTPNQTSTTLVNRVNRDTDLATSTTVDAPHRTLAPKATRLVTKTTQSQILATVDTSVQTLDKTKYQPTAN